jgi:hypothetical protein
VLAIAFCGYQDLVFALEEEEAVRERLHDELLQVNLQTIATGHVPPFVAW